LFFVVVVAAQVLVVLIVELALGTATLPGWLPMSNVIIIALMTVGLAVQILQLNSGFFEPEEKIAAPLPAPGGISLSTADEVLRQKLLDSMDAGYYRQTGLTIRQLADKLRYPEHQLRRLINGHLRYRNFSAFLNSYRIGEARAKLVDPESVRLPVLTIALDLGYASLGPFNRAFKAMTGMTPSEYRQSAAGRISANSE
jgi:AraC-like DNA-binding protein